MVQFRNHRQPSPVESRPISSHDDGNGWTLLVREMPHSAVANVAIWCRTGAAHEPAELSGISHSSSTCTSRDGALRTRRHGSRDQGSRGYNNAATSVEYTSYFASLPADNYPLALEVLADALLHSRFDPAEIERERAVICEEIGRKEDNPQGKLFVEFQAALGDSTPYGRPILGTRSRSPASI